MFTYFKYTGRDHFTPKKESMIRIRRFGNVFIEGERCPACSTDVDKGRLVAKKRTRWYLKCEVCKYSLLSEKTLKQKDKALSKNRDKELFKSNKRK